MKEDILEQLIEDYYVSRHGWFVKHNVKYRPDVNHPEYNSKQDSVNSDIDIIAINGLHEGCDKVHVITCKSWQGGFNINRFLKAIEGDALYNNKNIPGFQKKEDWKNFRELVSDKWLESFLKTIHDETGQIEFTYEIAVTKLIGTQAEKEAFENSVIIKKRFQEKKSKINIKIITVDTIISDIYDRIKNKQTTTTESTDIGRLLQIIHAAEIKI
jgi:hypothetical protein